jgi:hypothetical protein
MLKVGKAEDALDVIDFVGASTLDAAELTLPIAPEIADDIADMSDEMALAGAATALDTKLFALVKSPSALETTPPTTELAAETAELRIFAGSSVVGADAAGGGIAGADTGSTKGETPAMAG